MSELNEKNLFKTSTNAAASNDAVPVEGDLRFERAERRGLAVVFVLTIFGLGLGTFGNFYHIFREYVGELHSFQNVVQMLTFRQEKGAAPDAPATTATTDGDSPAAATAKSSARPRVSAEKAAFEKAKRRVRFAKKVTYNVEDMYTRYFYRVDFFVDWCGFINKAFGRTVIYASPKIGYYRTSYGYLFPILGAPCSPNAEKTGTLDEKSISELNEFYRFLQERGTRFLYIFPAVKRFDYLNAAFAGKPTENCATVRLEREFLNRLDKYRIPYLYGRDELIRRGVDPTETFYKTDHHWRLETGFQLLPSVVEGLGLHPKDDESSVEVDDYFTPISRPNFFIGSTGRQVGRFFCRPDDFTYFVPKEKTSFQVDYHHRVTHEAISKTGSFEEVVVTPKNIDPRDRYANRYGVYFGVDLPVLRIKNLTTTSQAKIILVKTSHALPIIGFLSMYAKELIVLDFRHMNESEGTLREIVERENPDAVTIVYSENELSSIRFN